MVVAEFWTLATSPASEMPVLGTVTCASNFTSFSRTPLRTARLPTAVAFAWLLAMPTVPRKTSRNTNRGDPNLCSCWRHFGVITSRSLWIWCVPGMARAVTCATCFR